ncbi:MAG: TlpA family protein disulfide reductase [Prevotella sp.]
MQKLKTFLFLSLVCALAVIPMSPAYGQDLDAKYATTLLPSGSEAPDFTIPSIVEGESVSLSHILSGGSYVILDFWASWCSDCRREIPSMKRLADEYKDYNLKVIGISYDTDATAWKNCVSQYDMQWIHCSELKRWHHGTTTDTPYGIKWVPSFYLLSPDGRVVIGTVEMGRLEEAVRKLADDGKLRKTAAD